MMQEIAFFVHGTPRPAPRPRFGNGRAFHGSSADSWKAQIARSFAVLRRGPMKGALHLEIQFIFAPGSVLGAGCWHTSRPDLDNLEKAAMDALNGYAWHDDCQVAAITSSKCVSKAGESIGARIRISQIQEEA